VGGKSGGAHAGAPKNERRGEICDVKRNQQKRNQKLLHLVRPETTQKLNIEQTLQGRGKDGRNARERGNMVARR